MNENPLVKSGDHPRYDYLDNIKWSLAILVILHHAAAIAGKDTFPINLPQVAEAYQYQYTILRSFQSVNQGFFMSLFFFISAYFVIPSYTKKGSRLFLKDKFKRLGVPTLATILVIDPLAMYISHDLPFFASLRDSFLQYGSMLRSLNLIMGVTWFCWTLIVFNVIFVLSRRFVSSEPPTVPEAGPLPSTLKILLFATLMIPFNYAGLYLMNVLGEDFLGFHLLKYFPMYIAMFCLGLQAQKKQWIQQLTFRHAFTWIVIWIAARIFLTPLSNMVSRPFEVIGMSIFLLYSCQTLFNGRNRLSQMLSRSAYAAYVLQIIPLCILGKIYMPYMTPFPVINFLILGATSVSITFLLAHLLLKAPFVGKIL